MKENVANGSLHLRFVEYGKKKDIKQWFKEIAGFVPYPYQIEIFQLLQEGKSVLLRAPTGTGKTEAVLVPFLKMRREKLPNRLIYSLPVRVLVEDIGERANIFAQKLGLSLSIHHGARKEDPMFQNDIIVTTVDQTIASYACTPLSFSQKHGSIPAGAVATSFLVFDEVQLLDPELGFQAMLVLTKHSVEMGFPVVIMTATLPSIFIEKFVEELPKHNVEVIDADEDTINVRKNRNVKIFWRNKFLTPEEVQRAYKNALENKIIVICNTVKKAQEFYRTLNVHPKYLLHSRFLNEDRASKEKEIKQIFGKNGNGEGVLITTQVIEAGLNISSPLILTEIAPIDSLIQRVGRCARWGGEGRVLIYDVENSAPYLTRLVEKTKRAIRENNGVRLNWSLEKSLIDNVLTDFTKEIWLNHEKRGSVIALLSEGAFEGKKEKITKAIREEFCCEISCHNNPSSLNNVDKLAHIRVPFGVVKTWIKKYHILIWEISESNIIDDDIETKWYPLPVTEKDIIPFKRYILSGEIGYNKELGLLPGEKGENFPLMVKNSDASNFWGYEYKEEPWVIHSRKAEKEAEKLLNSLSFELETISKALNMHDENLKRLILLAVKLHDIGKLNKKWQDCAGWDGITPLAHSPKVGKIPHATVSAYALSKWVCENFPENTIYEAVLLAIAHHHSLRSSFYKGYSFISDWKKVLSECGVDRDVIENIIHQKGSPFHLPTKFPDFKNCKLYRTYVFISRILKFADWKATGGEKCHITY